MDRTTIMLHDLLRSGQLQAAVSWVLSERAPDSSRFGELLNDLRMRSSWSDARDIAEQLALYLLARGDYPGARLAYSMTLPLGEAPKTIETAQVVPDPGDCFQFEPLIEADQRNFPLEPLLVIWSRSAQIQAEQRRVSPRVARLDRGRIFGLSFIPITEDGRACLNWYTHNANNPNNIVMAEDVNTIPLLCPNAIMGCFEGVDEYGEGVLIGNHENFGHWLLNHLARLALTSCAPALKGVPLVVGENIAPTQLQCLERMGYRGSMLIRLRKGYLARFNALWAPMMPFCSFDSVLHWSPRIVDFLRDRLGVREAPSSRRNRRLYLTRRDSRWRRVLNENEIVGNLAKQGFEIINPADLTIPQQIEMAGEAEVIMGPFGAGMNLLLFAPRDATIIEFKHHRRIMDINPALCRQIGQRYIPVAATPASSSSDPINADLFVAPRDVEEALKAANIAP
jgi:hypothetical protein